MSQHSLEITPKTSSHLSHGRPTGHVVVTKSVSHDRKGPSDGAKSLITIDSSLASDAGVYICRAESAYDVAQGHAVVTLGGELEFLKLGHF